MFNDWAERGRVARLVEVGPIRISIIAGHAAYCQPRTWTALPIESWEQVEIALIKDDKLARPEDCGLDRFKCFFEDGESPVAGYLHWDTVNGIIADLEKLHDCKAVVVKEENQKEEW